jgi:D-arabinose 1-dehydrogenase-like Zn-dependent alcohol dehydrogenase
VPATASGAASCLVPRRRLTKRWAIADARAVTLCATWRRLRRERDEGCREICIFGAGAIGGYLAVLLKGGGADVSVVARGKQLEAIRARGLVLQVDGVKKQARMPATDDPATLGPQDYVIVALKAHQAWRRRNR